ncbi:hypothetical protein C8R45DRAFT_930791 [Mycena sanguinolenta]|nr:hypothetical protein C8R45DRAFT_930791 [Mycena sanguinolenta]
MSAPVEDGEQGQGEEYDPVWENAMQALMGDGEEGIEECMTSCIDAVMLEKAEMGQKTLAKRKEEVLKAQFKRATAQAVDTRQRALGDDVPVPVVAKQSEQEELATALLKKYSKEGEGTKCVTLTSWQKTAVAMIHKHRLNEKQTLAFLLLADQVGNQLDKERAVEPLRMLVTGPGGMGKSRI